MKIHLLSLCLICMYLISCGGDSKIIKFIVPDSLNGIIRLEMSKKGVDPNTASALKIPPNGVLKVSNFDMFQDWHVNYVIRENGTIVNSNSDSAVVNEVCFWGLGSRYDETGRVDYYFIGNKDEYTKLIAERNW